MGGNRRKKLNKSSSRGGGRSGGNHGLFVEGGFLSDLPSFSSPPSRGRKGNNEGNRNSRSVTGKGSNRDSMVTGSSGEAPSTQRIRGKAVGYIYPQVSEFLDGGINLENNIGASNPKLLANSEKSPVAVYLDEGPVKESENVEYMYDYTTNFTLVESSHQGLGFHDEGETTPNGIGYSSKMEEEESYSLGISSFGEVNTAAEIYDDHDEAVEDLMAGMSFGDENQGYLLIGGRKIYTEDISDEDEDEGLSGEENSGSSDSEDCSETSESYGSSYSGSDIDDEVAADYFEGISGNSNTINVDRLICQFPDAASDSEGSFDGTVNMLGGINLQKASREYGMSKNDFSRKYRREDKNLTPVKYAYPSPLDDSMLIKDPRTFSGKKKHIARFPESWPCEARKSKKLRRIPGEKKKHRKEMIAAKRRDRMVHRGVDLQKISLTLQQIVLDGMDMQSFTPMHLRDCSQVRRLAAIYRLRSVCQGSGKKRFVTVVRTQHTCMPSASDKIRLEKLIGADKDADFLVVNGKTKPVKVGAHGVSSASRVGASAPVSSQSFRKKSNKNSVTYKSSKEAKQTKTGKVGSYSAQPVSFVSSGILNNKVVEIESNEEKGTCSVNKLEANAGECGAFEMHTTGFGSKMLAKMGYVEGGGLGKDGGGMAHPIEVSQRPKSLGLGAEVPETTHGSINTKPQPKSIGRKTKSFGGNSKSEKNESQKLGSFEKHTMGFGSKMMAKMGFVDGTGLGKDSQGIISPLAAVRRPRSMGLGAKS